MNYESLLFRVKRQRGKQQVGREMELEQNQVWESTPETGDGGFTPEPGGQVVLVRAGVGVSQAWDLYPHFWVSGPQFLICRMGQ